jgi:N-acetylglucosaminyldiphosphoundecaprenol N-acetyl-beta-D-mannosaminyltransferase
MPLTSERLPAASTPGTATRRVNVLGVGVSAINMELALATIGGWIDRRALHYVCVSGVHGVIESQRSERLRHIHNAAGLVTPDGMPLVWIGRAVTGLQVDRVYGPDLMLACCERLAARGCRHFFYGGAPEVPERLAARLQARVPEMVVAGTYSPPFGAVSAEQDEAIVRMINDAQPDLVWVGLSTPKQERWMHEHRGRLHAPVLLGVGAAFDFHAGLKRQAPRWMQRNGLEWLFRLLSEPRRLGRRYLVNNPQFVWLLLRQSLGLSSYDLSTGTLEAAGLTSLDLERGS